MEKIMSYFKEKYMILNLLFGAVFSIPVVLGGLLYSMAQGVNEAEDGVIIYIIFLFMYDVIYLVIYFLINKIPKKVFSLFFINDKKKFNTAENLFFDEDYVFNFNSKDSKNIKIDGAEREILKNYAKNIIYKKLIVRLSLFLTIFTFLVFGMI